MSSRIALALMACFALGCFTTPTHAGVVWDGDGAAADGWGTAANWDSDTLPAFDGSDDIVFTTINAAGVTTTLDADRNINSLTTTPTQNVSISGNTLTLQSGNITGSSTSNTVTLDSAVTLGANGTFDIGGGGSGQFTVNGAIGDGGSGFSLTKTGARRLNLNGTNTYTGETKLNGGLVYIGGNVAPSTNGPVGNSTSAVVLGETSANSTFVLPNVGQTFGRDLEVSSAGTGSVRIDSYAGSGITTLSGNVALDRNAIIYGNHGGGTNQYYNITGIISGTGNLSVHRNVRLSAANTYTGTTTIGEHLSFFAYLGADAPNGAPGAFGNATSDVVMVSSGLNVDGTFTVGRNLSITGNFGLTQYAAGTGTFDGNINMPNATTTTLSVNSGSQVFNGVISGIGGLRRYGGQGNPTYINNGNNSFSGLVEIKIGDVLVGANAPSGSNGALGNSTAAILFDQVHIAHSSSLLTNGPYTIGRDIDVANSAANSISTLGGNSAHNSAFEGDIDVNSNSTARLTAESGGHVTFSGTISGDGIVTKIGAGTVELSGANTYLGATTAVTAGTLLATNTSGSATSASAVTVSSGATLGGDGSIAGSVTINSGAFVAPGTSAGTLTVADLTISNGSTYQHEAEDLIAVNNQLDLDDDWTLELIGPGFVDGGSTVLFTYGSLASSPDLDPTIDITSLGFVPSGSLSLSDTGSSIILNGISLPPVPEPSTFLLLGLGAVGLVRHTRRRSQIA